MPYIGTNPTNRFSSVEYQDLTGVTGSPAKRGFTLNTAVGSANDFVDEIRETAGLITDITQGISGQMTLFLEDSLVGFIETGLAGVKSFFFSIYKANPLLALAQTKAFNGAAFGPIQRLFNTFECLGSTIASSMFKTIQDMLVNAVKKGFVNPVVCAVEDFVGAITNQITINYLV